MRPGRRASYREGASYGAVNYALSIALSVVSSVACSRLYGIDKIGEYALTLGAVSAVRLLSTAKERPALVRELTQSEPRAPRVTGLFAGTVTFSAALTILVGAIAVLVCRLLLSGPIARPGLFAPLTVNVAGYVLFGNICENLDVVSSAFRAGRLLLWVRIGDALSFLVLAVAFTYTDSVWGLVLAAVLSQAVGVLHRLLRIRGYMRFTASREVLRDGFKSVPSLIRFGLKIAPGALADGASNESGTWLVASFSPIASVGAYGRAYLLIKQLMVVNVYISPMLFPTLVERRAENDGSGYARALVDSLRYSVIGLMLFAVAGGAAAQGVMHVFGPHFEQGANTLTVLLVVPALMMVSQLQRFALYSLDRPWLATASGLTRFVFTIAMGIWLTNQFGAIGAACALVLGFLLDVSIVTSLVVRHLATPLRTLWKPREWVSLAGACTIGFAAGRVTYGLCGYPLGLFAASAVATIAFVAVLVLTGAVNQRDISRCQSLRQAAAARTRRGARPVAGPEPAATAGPSTLA